MQSLQKNTMLEWALFLILVCGYYIWLSRDTVHSASANGRLLDRYQVDEYQLFNVTYQALIDRTPYLDWSVYGHLYFNLALIPLVLIDLFTTVSEQLVILTLRYISLISSALTVILTFTMSKRYASKFAAWMSAIFLMTTPTVFNYWSITIHPDTLQMLTVAACLLVVSSSLEGKQDGYTLRQFVQVCLFLQNMLGHY